MDTTTLEAAAARTSELMANVTSDEYGLATPCQSWDVRALLNHVVAAANWVAHLVESGEAPEDDPYEHVDYVAAGIVGAHDAAVSAALDVLRRPGALERRVTTPYGEWTGSFLLELLIQDEVVHGWDLAKATGQALSETDEQLASELLAARHALDAFRGPDGKAPYGAEVVVPESAPASDRLAGFFGRTP